MTVIEKLNGTLFPTKEGGVYKIRPLFGSPKTYLALLAQIGPQMFSFVSLDDGNRIVNSGNLQELLGEVEIIAEYNATVTLEKK